MVPAADVARAVAYSPASKYWILRQAFHITTRLWKQFKKLPISE